jgi:hypothetical protein
VLVLLDGVGDLLDHGHQAAPLFTSASLFPLPDLPEDADKDHICKKGNKSFS